MSRDLYDLLFGDGQHKHRCPSCGTVWEHGNNCAMESHDVYVQSHTCPQCGKAGIIQKYHGDAEANMTQVCRPDTVELEFK
jgi:predicted RNA-binding Zn-ribbon protein involved in translation (DUF1610 family)